MDRSRETENKLVFGVQGKGELGVTVNRYRVLFLVGNIVNLGYDSCTTLNILKNSDFTL